MSNSTTAKDGGPAFPLGVVTSGNTSHVVYPAEQEARGMSLRDYFAGQALMAVHQFAFVSDSRTDRLLVSEADRMGSLARTAYAIADALIAERAKAEGR